MRTIPTLLAAAAIAVGSAVFTVPQAHAGCDLNLPAEQFKYCSSGGRVGSPGPAPQQQQPAPQASAPQAPVADHPLPAPPVPVADHPLPPPPGVAPPPAPAVGAPSSACPYFDAATGSTNCSPVGSAPQPVPAAQPVAPDVEAAPAPANVVYPGVVPQPYAPPLSGYYDPLVSSPCNPANGSPTCSLSDPNALPIAGASLPNDPNTVDPLTDSPCNLAQDLRCEPTQGNGNGTYVGTNNDCIVGRDGDNCIPKNAPVNPQPWVASPPPGQ